MIKKILLAFLVIPAFALCAQQDKLRMIMPPEIYAVTGHEINLYFDNVILTPNMKNFVFDVSCPKGRQDEIRWRMIPEKADEGTISIELKVLDQEDKTVSQGKSVIRIVPENAGAGKEFSILIVGDSLTDASVYPNELKKLLQESGNPDVKFIGSHVGHGKAPDGIKAAHEGRAGWAWGTFCKTWDPVKDDYRNRSPFIFPDETGKTQLDFKKYLEKYNGGKSPDYIIVFLGTNDTFSADDASINNAIDTMFSNADTLIAEFRKVSPQTQIGLITTIPPAASQDAFGENYRCGQTRWQFRKNQHRLVERLYRKFKDSEKDGISVIPAYINIDCENNYPKKSEVLNARNPGQRPKLCNGVHPAMEGYRQIADSLFYWLKYKLSGGN